MTTVVNLNLWHTQPPYDARMAAARKYFAQATPDVAFFEEVEFSGSWNQTRAFLDPTYHVFAAVADEPPGRQEGVALASRTPLVKTRAVRLDSASNEPERLVLLALTADPEPALLAVTHLAWRPRSDELRARQAAQTAAAFAEAAADWDAHRGFLGLDANATPLEPAVQTLIAAGFTDACADGPLAERPTWAATNPYVPASAGAGGRIDYVLGWGTGAPSETAIVLDTAPYASDHYGVWARY